MIVTTSACIVCHKTSQVELSQDQYNRLKSREPIQVVLPHFSDDTRELLISGTHPECWETFAPDEHEEEEDQPFNSWDDSTWNKVQPPF